LLKPVSFGRFTKAINNFLELESSQNITTQTQEIPKKESREFIFLKADKKHYKVNLNDILYFESLGDYVIAFTVNKKIITKERIGKLLEDLPKEQFLQIHRGYIVSISKIDSVGPGFVEINKKKLPVGRNFKPELAQLLHDPQ
jgi:DNA-binding LytR/AlgR family response regulator